MAKILLDDEWFEQIAPNSLYETDYENLILQHAKTLYPSFYALPFKKTVYSNEDSAKPDMVLIEKKYRSWWVVEVEMGHHSLEGHVLPQVTTLATADYSEDIASYLCEKAPYLVPDSIRDMIKGRSPEVLIVVNEVRLDWVAPLERYNARVAFFEIFRSVKNRFVFRVNGYQLPIPADVISECRFDPNLPNFLTIDSPAGLGIPRQGKVSLRHGDGISEWQRVDASDKVWLIPVSTNPLSSSQAYYLLRQEDGALFIRPKS